MKQQQTMRNSLSILLIFLSSITYALNVENCFSTMPNALLPVLTQQQRIELLEYYKAELGDSIENRFGNQSCIQFFDTTTQHLKVQTTESSTFELFILQPDTLTQPIIGIIRTICAPICHSSVAFYDSAWHTIPTPFDIPKAAEWINASALTENEDAKSLIQPFLSINFISLQFDAKNSTLVAFNNNLDFLTTEERKQVQPFIKQEAIHKRQLNQK